MTAPSKLSSALRSLALSAIGIASAGLLAPAVADTPAAFTIRNKTGLPDTQIRL